MLYVTLLIGIQTNIVRIVLEKQYFFCSDLFSLPQPKRLKQLSFSITYLEELDNKKY